MLIMILKNLKLSEKIFLSALNDQVVKEWMLKLKEHHIPTYLHSVKTSILAIDIAIGKNFLEEDIEKIAKATLLHEVGCLDVDPKILDREASCEIRNEEMKKAIRSVFDKINGEEYDDIRKIIIAHHEFNYSNPFPRNRIKENNNMSFRRKKEDYIDSLAQIVGLANMLEEKIKNLHRKDIEKDEIRDFLENEFMGDSKFINQIMARL